MWIYKIEDKIVKENFRKNFPHMQIHSRARWDTFCVQTFITTQTNILIRANIYNRLIVMQNSICF